MPSVGAEGKEGEISQMMREIEEIVAKLEEAIEEISKRTSTVARRKVPEEQSSEKAAGSTTDLGSQLMSSRDRIKTVSKDLLDLIDRIEL